MDNMDFSFLLCLENNMYRKLSKSCANNQKSKLRICYIRKNTHFKDSQAIHLALNTLCISAIIRNNPPEYSTIGVI
jgi:hypothetical protein